MIKRIVAKHNFSGGGLILLSLAILASMILPNSRYIWASTPPSPAVLPQTGHGGVAPAAMPAAIKNTPATTAARNEGSPAVVNGVSRLELTDFLGRKKVILGIAIIALLLSIINLIILKQR